MPSPATWGYDGVSTVAVTFNAVIGKTYDVVCSDPDSTGATITASATSETVTISDVGGMDDTEYFFAYVQNADIGDGEYIDAAVFHFGHTSSGHDSVAAVTYDGDHSFEWSYLTDVGGQYSFVITGALHGGDSQTTIGDGTAGPFPFVPSPTTFDPGESFLYFLEREDDPGLAGYSDLFAAIGVWGAGPPAPIANVFDGGAVFKVEA